MSFAYRIFTQNYLLYLDQATIMWFFVRNRQYVNYSTKTDAYGALCKCFWHSDGGMPPGWPYSGWCFHIYGWLIHLQYQPGLASAKLSEFWALTDSLISIMWESHMGLQSTEVSSSFICSFVWPGLVAESSGAMLGVASSLVTVNRFLPYQVCNSISSSFCQNWWNFPWFQTNKHHFLE